MTTEPKAPALTEIEAAMLAAFIVAGAACNGSSNAEEMKADNMTWMSPIDLAAFMDVSRYVVAGTMGQLQRKGLIQWSGDYTPEMRRESGNRQFYATDAGIDLYFAGARK